MALCPDCHGELPDPLGRICPHCLFVLEAEGRPQMLVFVVVLVALTLIVYVGIRSL